MKAERAIQSSKVSYYEHGARRLSALCRANGLEDRLEQTLELFKILGASWGDQPVTTGSRGWVSDVADDHSPFEFSVVYGGRYPEVRILVEAQSRPATLEGNWQAG